MGSNGIDSSRGSTGFSLELRADDVYYYDEKNSKLPCIIRKERSNVTKVIQT